MQCDVNIIIIPVTRHVTSLPARITYPRPSLSPLCVVRVVMEMVSTTPRVTAPVPSKAADRTVRTATPSTAATSLYIQTVFIPTLALYV